MPRGRPPKITRLSLIDQLIEAEIQKRELEHRCAQLRAELGLLTDTTDGGMAKRQLASVAQQLIAQATGSAATAATTKPLSEEEEARREHKRAYAREYWRKHRGKKSGNGAKRRISAAGRKRMSEANRVRWAKYRAEKAAAEKERKAS